MRFAQKNVDPSLLPTCWAHVEVQAGSGQVQQVPDEARGDAVGGQHHGARGLHHHRAHQAVRLQAPVRVWKVEMEKRKPKR